MCPPASHIVIESVSVQSGATAQQCERPTPRFSRRVVPLNDTQRFPRRVAPLNDTAGDMVGAGPCVRPRFARRDAPLNDTGGW